MAETILLKEIKHVLSQFNRYWDNEILLKNRVSEDLRNYDPELITALLSNEKIKEQFEISIDQTSIFKIEELIQMLTYKDFWEDSYTKYSNKIGLTANGKYLDYNSDVVLDFPFKDCVLEGGMTKEEVGKKEVYYNKVIARDEVDTLLSPKVFTNTKKYTKDGEEEVSEIADTDNLILKGNNLLALHSLKKRYAGKIKCIYIDPPYYFSKKMQEDSFKYNSNYKLSTWLTFMKDRLYLCKELLSSEGVIFIQMNDDGISHLKILMDEIFGSANFVNQISVKMSEPTGVKMAHVNLRLPKLKEHILMYKKRNIQVNPVLIPKKEWDSEYKTFIKNFSLENYKKIIELEQQDSYTEEEIENVDSILSKVEFISISEAFKEFKIVKENQEKFLFDNAFRIVQIASMTGGAKKIADRKKEMNNSPAFSIVSPKKELYIIKNFYDESKDSPRIKILFAQKYLTVNAGDFWSDIKTTGLDNEGGYEFLNGKKPEKLLERIISMVSSNQNDIILDFFMGSATTQAVAMKMNRQFIGIEQMDYINTVSVPRLQNVMEGEQGGISKGVNWNGGGSFIYTELMDLNNAYINQIKEVETSTELLDILETIKKYADLNYLVELEKLTSEPITIDEDTKETLSFEELDINKQRELLIDVMDINQLYVNYSEIDDSMYQVSEQDKAFNRSFYEAGGN